MTRMSFGPWFSSHRVMPRGVEGMMGPQSINALYKSRRTIGLMVDLCVQMSRLAIGCHNGSVQLWDYDKKVRPPSNVSMKRTYTYIITLAYQP